MKNGIELTCKAIEKDFYKNKHWKKKLFLNVIKSLFLFLKVYEHNTPKAKIRATILRLCYIYFREIDDLIDGDKLLPNSIIDFSENKKVLTDYVHQRRLYLENGCNSSNPNELDNIIKTIIDLSATLGLDIQGDSIKLLDCMLFDLDRKCDLQNGHILTSPSSKIDKYFFGYYYDSCIKITVLLSTSNPIDIKNKNIKDLGYAQRIYFNLIDFFEDMSFGIINIPKEDVSSLGISDESLIKLSKLPKKTINLCKDKGFNHPDVFNIIDEPIQIWLNQQLTLGLNCLTLYQKTAPLRTYKQVIHELLCNRTDFSDIILRLGIEKGTTEYLKKLEKQRNSSF